MISNLISFEYANYNAVTAANDLYERLKVAQDKLDISPVEEHVVVLAIDGENCWENYKNDGLEFLRALYTLLNNDETIDVTTVSDYLEKIKIKPILKSATASFGITALNELQELYNGKSLVEDGQFAVEVMEYINKKVTEFKEKDGNLYALYGTPAENLCGLQIKQFVKKYGVIENVSDRPYVSNSFHCHVTEDISPIEKQDLEGRFWDLLNGGKIQYVRYPINYNTEAFKTLVKRAMDLGFYEGVNLSLAYCDDCGHEELEMDVCPKCGSQNLTKIDRMNGYLAYSRVHGQTRLNDAKMSEIAERKSM